MKTAYLELSITHHDPGDRDNKTGADEYHLYFSPLNINMSNKRIILIDVFPTHGQAVNKQWELKKTTWKNLGEFLRVVGCENYCYPYYYHLSVCLRLCTTVLF